MASCMVLVCFGIGYILVIYWLCIGYILVIYWLYIGYILVMYWLCIGYILVIHLKQLEHVAHGLGNPNHPLDDGQRVQYLTIIQSCKVKGVEYSIHFDDDEQQQQ